MQVVPAPGARVARGQLTARAGPAGAARVVATEVELTVTLPAFVTAKTKVTLSPARVSDEGEADTASCRAPFGVAVTVALEAGEVTAVPSGAVAPATAEFAIEPASRSACEAAYVSVHVVPAPGARVVVGQLTAAEVPAGAVKVSLTPSPVSVTLPVLVTAKE